MLRPIPRLIPRPILGMAVLALTGCATTVTTTAPIGAANRGVLAAQGCYEAANGRIAARQGLHYCNMALADRGLAPALHTATLVNRGVLHMKTEAHAAALQDYDAAIAAAPANADAYINKGILLLRMGGRDADAVAVLTEALAHAPARPELVYYYRAGAYEGLGLLRDAYNDYSEAAQLAPDWAEPANQLQRFKFVRRKTLAG
jgi:tetratricopeptide (TPR) repeat protein